MTERRRLLGWCGAAAACTAAAFWSFRPATGVDREPVPPLAPVEESADEAGGHALWLWTRLRDPHTGRIPPDIGTRENAFARRLAEDVDAEALGVTGTWVPRGPAKVGGRSKAVAVDVTNESVILAGGVSSGMWKSTDGGTSWRKTTRPSELQSVSCIAQNTAPGRQNTWYYGTGESWPNYRGGAPAGPAGTNAFYRGDGIYKSTDGGETWTHLTSTAGGDPTRDLPFSYVAGLATFGVDGVYAATSTGLYASTDGGGTWTHVLDFGTGYPTTEVAFGPGGVAYATIGGSGPANGIYRSTDGAHWAAFNPPAWPAKTLRTLIGVAPSNPSVVYFFCAEDEPTNLVTHLFKYVEGSGWTDLRANLPWGGNITTYGGNMMSLRVKPDDERTVFLGSTGLFRSMDGGASFELIGGGGSYFHVDQHALVFFPSDPRRMIAGNDGGLFLASDDTAPAPVDPGYGEKHIPWKSLNNGYRTTQFYSAAVDHGTPGSVLVSGGMQDNGCQFSPSADPGAEWQVLSGGDGGISTIASGGRLHYTSNAATLFVQRHDLTGGTDQWTEITPKGARMGLWLAPLLLDPHDSRVMYLPAGPDLWRNSDLTQIPFSWPSTGPTDVNWTKLPTAAVGGSITALAMSDALPRRLYYGTWPTTGWGLYRIDDPQTGAPTPVALSTAGLPPWAYVGCIAADPRDVDRLLVSFPNYGIVSIFASADGGRSWTPVAGNLEEQPNGSGAGPSVRWVATLYVQNRPVYFAATSVGLYSTTTLNGAGTVWVQEGASTIGNIVVDMVDVRQSDGYVAVATQGNGVYTTTVTAISGPQVRRHVHRAGR